MWWSLPSLPPPPPPFFVFQSFSSLGDRCCCQQGVSIVSSFSFFLFPFPFSAALQLNQGAMTIERKGQWKYECHWAIFTDWLTPFTAPIDCRSFSSTLELRTTDERQPYNSGGGGGGGNIPGMPSGWTSFEWHSNETVKAAAELPLFR